jgi:hypothetical protein
MLKHTGWDNDLVSYLSDSDETHEDTENRNVRSGTNIRSPQAVEFYEMDFSGMTFDLQCCTSALMDFLPAMDKTWDIMQWVDPRSLRIAPGSEPSARQPTGLPAGREHSGDKWWRRNFWRTGISRIAEVLSSLELD